MKVLIKETGEETTLTMINPESGVDCVADFIGVNGGLNDDEQFVYDNDSGIYTTSQENFDWWKKVIGENETLNERISELKEEHDSEKVDRVVMEASDGVELEYLADAVNAALDEMEAGPEEAAKDETSEEVKKLIAAGNRIEIISGEGEVGTVEPYDGERTVEAIKDRLEERCDGDRWARARVFSHENNYGGVYVNIETGEFCS